MTARVLLVGKTGAIVHLHENLADGFRDAGCQLHEFAVNGARWTQKLYLKTLRLIDRDQSRRVLIEQFSASVDRLHPDLIFFIFPFYYPPQELFDAALAAPGSPLLAGWVGDRFQQADATVARKLHRLYYTDSQFLADAERWNFPDNGCYLPLAADPKRFRPMHADRDARMVFVANVTGHRQNVVKSVRKSLVVWGRHWDRMQHTPHEIHGRRLPQQVLPGTYGLYRAALNIRNENNVLSGINQRSFEPSACGTPVVNDDMPDLERCFEPGKEILIYRDEHELNALYERLLEDASYARSLGEAARRRVLAEHTYAIRARTILTDLGLTR